MKNLMICTLLAGMAASALLFLELNDSTCTAADSSDRMLAHDVYFSLKDNSTTARIALVAGCTKFLSNHPGSVWFAAGNIAKEHQREVNDQDFDVALHVVFKDKTSHDKYQQARKHHEFIEEFKDNWKTVRVFDSWLDATSHIEFKD